MAASRAPKSNSSYHVFAPRRGDERIGPRSLFIRAVVAVSAFFGLVILAALLVVLSPTLSRSLTAVFIAPQSGAIPWNGTDPVNMVIAGVDLRPGQTADPHTDTLMALSIRPRDGSIRMLSIPRDLYVSIPGTGQEDRINDAYAVGGAKLLMKTVEGVVNMPIRYYAIINFTGFAKVIDALGGVTIDVKRTIWDPTYPALTGNGYSPLYLKKGVHHMDGALALKYVRERHVYALQDLERNVAQQQLLSALKSQVLTPGTLVNLPVILGALHNAVDTNFPYDGLTYLFRTAITAHSIHRYLNYQNSAVSNYQTSLGADVLLPNWPRIHWIAHRTFSDPELASSPVTILNGGGVTGAAATLKHWLHASGYHVTSIGDAGSSNYVQSQVIRNSSVGGGDYVARMLGDQLQTRVISRAMPGVTTPVVVIVGQDWTTPIQS